MGRPLREHPLGTTGECVSTARGLEGSIHGDAARRNLPPRSALFCKTGRRTRQDTSGNSCSMAAKLAQSEAAAKGILRIMRFDRSMPDLD